MTKTVYRPLSADTFQLLSASLLADPTDGADTLQGTDANEVLDGRGGNDLILGAGGSDTLIGGLGDDTVKGGAGNDIYVWGPGLGNDTITDDSGNDELRIDARVSDITLSRDPENPLSTLQIHLGNETLSIVNYFGTWGRVEKIVFSDGTTLDFFQVVRIVQNQAPIPSRGDTIYGGDGDDVLIGTDRDDLIIANSGDDVIEAGLGRDEMWGGDGRDTFRFVSVNQTHVGKNRDIIQDFLEQRDLIDLSNIDANTTTLADNAFTKILIGTKAFTAAGQLRYNPKTGILSGNTDRDAAAEFEIKLANKPLKLSLSDFVL